MVAIDPKFVDCDFRDFPQYTPGDLGMDERFFERYGSVCYEDRLPLVPESDWKTEIEKAEQEKSGNEWLVQRIYDQMQEGSCVANACAASLEDVYFRQFGKHIPFSAMSLYKRIGSGPNSGAMVSDGLSELRDRGILPLDTPENRAIYGDKVMPNTGWRTPFPADWENTANYFRIHEWFVIQSVEGMISALLNGHPVVVGRQGHSIKYVQPAYRNGGLGVIYANSWGNWGFGAGKFKYGFGFDSQRLVSQSSGWAFAIVSATDYRR